MTYTNDTKPSGSYSSGDTKPVANIGSVLYVGNPIGLLLTLTYAIQIISDGFIADTKPTGSFTNDNKPT